MKIQLTQKAESRTNDHMQSPSPKTHLSVRFWGTRGSCAAPFPDRMIYGGNTSCVSVHWEEGTAIFDAGTGILALGEWMKRKKEAKKPIHLFIGHLHLDHIAALPLFPLLFEKEARFHLYGPREKEKTFKERLLLPLSPPYWPISLEQVPASITWHEAESNQTWKLPGNIKVSAMRSNHPDQCLIYRLESQGQSVVYGLDCEFFEPSSQSLSKPPEPKSLWTAYQTFAWECSLLIFDAPYTQKEYPSYCGFGHSYWEKGIEMAKACRASRLYICHHNWDRSDKALAQIEKDLHLQARKTGLQAEIAREGQCIHLPPPAPENPKKKKRNAKEEKNHKKEKKHKEEKKYKEEKP